MTNDYARTIAGNSATGFAPGWSCNGAFKQLMFPSGVYFVVAHGPWVREVTHQWIGEDGEVKQSIEIVEFSPDDIKGESHVGTH
jgi:hypothetical protein